MCTRDAWAARNTAACAAELPAPTSTTSIPAHILASVAEAPYRTPRPSNCAIPGVSGRLYRAPLAMTTDLPRTALPSASITVNRGLPSARSRSSAIACAGITISAPNFCACTNARPASA